ncbi:MAG: CBS domain-containing protein [Ignavibacteria bacterium]|nr:CBS domain-containing protein [Ignavibacteria bacterium]
MKSLRDICSSKPTFVAKCGQTVYDVICEMAKNNIGALPVIDEDGKLKGIFTERDVLIRCVAKRINIDKVKIEEVMTKGVIIMEAHDSYEECLKIMKQEGIRHMPVRDGDKLIGIVSMRDLMAEDVEEKKQEIENLNSYIYYYK